MTRFASEKMVNFIFALNAERGLPEIPRETLALMPFQEARETIDRLLKMPKVARAAAPAEGFVKVDPGYYGVEYDGVLRFYRVKEGKGRWAGRTFVNRYASDHFAKIGRHEAYESRRLIAADPQAAAERFGKEIGRCYVCGRQLTDELSRSLGIGPDCRGRRGR